MDLSGKKSNADDEQKKNEEGKERKNTELKVQLHDEKVALESRTRIHKK